jgi:hypothetical protein
LTEQANISRVQNRRVLESGEDVERKHLGLGGQLRVGAQDAVASQAVDACALHDQGFWGLGFRGL